MKVLLGALRGICAGNFSRNLILARSEVSQDVAEVAKFLAEMHCQGALADIQILEKNSIDISGMEQNSVHCGVIDNWQTRRNMFYNLEQRSISSD